jgi:hypothetical protein
MEKSLLRNSIAISNIARHHCKDNNYTNMAGMNVIEVSFHNAGL